MKHSRLARIRTNVATSIIMESQEEKFEKLQEVQWGGCTNCNCSYGPLTHVCGHCGWPYCYETTPWNNTTGTQSTTNSIKEKYTIKKIWKEKWSKNFESTWYTTHTPLTIPTKPPTNNILNVTIKPLNESKKETKICHHRIKENSKPLFQQNVLSTSSTVNANTLTF